MEMKDMMKMFDANKVAEFWNMDNLKQLSEANLEKAKQANEVLVEGMNKYATRQAELTKECVESNIASVKEVAASKSAEEFVAKQQEVTKEWMEKNTSAVKELAEIARESNEKVADIVKEMMPKA